MVNDIINPDMIADNIKQRIINMVHDEINIRNITAGYEKYSYTEEFLAYDDEGKVVDISIPSDSSCVLFFGMDVDKIQNEEKISDEIEYLRNEIFKGRLDDNQDLDIPHHAHQTCKFCFYNISCSYALNQHLNKEFFSFSLMPMWFINK